MAAFATRGSILARIEVKRVHATMTRDEMEPQWEVVVSYGPMESLATALPEFASRIRKQFPNHFD
ncbi:MAG: hypothetical protein WA615_23045 [Bradyrhizobium sp.]|uniref:hypothetical protein n=1 Tax=Bradyrhizobium sp. TaxID=376 RepID=UPI003C7BF67A